MRKVLQALFYTIYCSSIFDVDSRGWVLTMGQNPKFWLKKCVTLCTEGGVWGRQVPHQRGCRHLWELRQPQCPQSWGKPAPKKPTPAGRRSFVWHPLEAPWKGINYSELGTIPNLGCQWAVQEWSPVGAPPGHHLLQQWGRCGAAVLKPFSTS